MSQRLNGDATRDWLVHVSIYFLVWSLADALALVVRLGSLSWMTWVWLLSPLKFALLLCFILRGQGRSDMRGLLASVGIVSASLISIAFLSGAMLPRSLMALDILIALSGLLVTSLLLRQMKPHRA